MNKNEFYRDKAVSRVEWWLESSRFPQVIWARLREFSDGTADACFAETDTLYGFESAVFAGYFLGEDEFRSLSSFDEEDEKEEQVAFSNLVPPTWVDGKSEKFEYLGTY